MACEGACGVEKTFRILIRLVAGSIQTQSVKVPRVDGDAERLGGGAGLEELDYHRGNPLSQNREKRGTRN